MGPKTCMPSVFPCIFLVFPITVFYKHCTDTRKLNAKFTTEANIESCWPVSPSVIRLGLSDGLGRLGALSLLQVFLQLLGSVQVVHTPGPDALCTTAALRLICNTSAGGEMLKTLVKYRTGSNTEWRYSHLAAWRKYSIAFW